MVKVVPKYKPSPYVEKKAKKPFKSVTVLDELLKNPPNLSPKKK
jgi:hypothetical protein